MSTAAIEQTLVSLDSIQDSLPVCLFENSNRLVSLLEIMNSFNARDLLFQVRSLRNTGLLIFDSKRSPSHRHEAIQQFKLNIGILKATCEQLGLSVAALQAGQLRDSIDLTIEIIASDSAERMCGMLSVTIENELSLRKFFAIPDEKAKVYGDGTEPLGSDVAASFPSSTFDASEAKRCFALSRNTACVFHLMRVLEIGLSAFAVKFNVSASHTNWETIINQIERAIKEPEQDQNRSPTWKDDREFYSQCASHFRIVKDAWRNYTAHARGKYDEQEASDMLTSVRGFMQKLATRLHE